MSIVNIVPHLDINNNNKFEFSIKGMTCSNCANSVQNKIKSYEGVLSANVNLITEKAMITTNNQKVVDGVKEMLNGMGYEVSNVNSLNRNNKNRIFTLECDSKDLDLDVDKKRERHDRINNIPGVVKINYSNKLSLSVNKGVGTTTNKYSDNVIKIEYDPEIIKGSQLHDEIFTALNINNTNININTNFDSNNNTETNISNAHSKYRYLNAFSENLENLNNFSFSLTKKDLIIIIILTLSVLFLCMVKTNISLCLNSILLFSPKITLYLILIILMSCIIIFKYGFSIYKRSFFLFKNHRVYNMETLISLGSISSILLALLNFCRLVIQTESDKINMNIMMTVDAFEAAATVISITLIGKHIEERAKNSIRKFSIKLLDQFTVEGEGKKLTWMKPRNKNFITLEEKSVDVGLLEKDEFVILKVNDYLLIDGLIVNGEVEIKENITFGYDVVIIKTTGDRIKSGCVVMKGSCVMKVEEVLEDSMLFKITSEMSTAMNQKLKLQNFIDKIMSYFVPGIIIISISTFSIWLFVYFKVFCLNMHEKENTDITDNYKYLTLSFIIERGISILVVSCPCSFGLAIPTVTAIAINMALKQGILIKNVGLLPEVRKSERFVFDKTGTLTDIVKNFKIEYEYNSEIRANIHNSETDIRDLPIYNVISHIETDQKHPIAEVLHAYCLKNNNKEDHNNDNKLIKNISSSKFTIINNKINVFSNGVQANIIFREKEYSVQIGNYDYFIKINNKFLNSQDDNNNDIDCDSKLKNIYQECINKRLNVIFVLIDNITSVIFSIDSSSELRREAKFLIDHLSKCKKEVYILSGDGVEGVLEVGRRLGIPEGKCIGATDNFQKKEILNNLKKDKKVLMIGDGVNDILSLSEADFGISFNTNSQLNLIASDIIFVKKDLRLLLSLLKLSKLTSVFIWINLFWACVYNLCMLPIVSGAFHFFWEIEMSPTASSFSMLCSSLLILLTANSLKLFNLDYSKSDINDKTVRTEHTQTQEQEIDIIGSVSSIIDIENPNKKYIRMNKNYYQLK